MEENKKARDHLPLFGVGPLYAVSLAAVTLAAVLLRGHPLIAGGRLPALRVPMGVLGILGIALGAFLWVQAVLVARLDDHILEDELVTTGVYAWVRNPIYSAFLFVCTGVLLLVGNGWLLILPVLYWLFLTVLMKATEEKWLLERFGSAYEEYCRRVNRCLPWFPKKDGERR